MMRKSPTEAVPLYERGRELNRGEFADFDPQPTIAINKPIVTSRSFMTGHPGDAIGTHSEGL